MTAELTAGWRRTLRRRGAVRAAVEAATGAACSFAELEARAQAWREARGLRPGGLRRRAAVLAVPNGLAWLESFLGLVQAGAVVVPLDGAEPPEAQRRTAEALGAAVRWDGAQLTAGEGRVRRYPAEAALIKLTSGTTGQPRPLVFTGSQVLADARQVTATMGIGEDDLNLASIPLGHSYGLGNLTLPLLAQGVPLVFGSSPWPQAVAADAARWRPTVWPTVPAMLRALMAADVEPAALASLRTTISAGAPLDPETARAFAARFGRPVHGFYGTSETGGIAYDRTGYATAAGGVGRALRGVTVVTVRGGRIEVRSAAVVTCGNRRRVGTWGAWRPADRVAVGPGGGLTLLGRRGEIVKLAGRRVNLAEVAARLRRLAGVRDVWVGTSEGAEPVLGAAVAMDRPRRPSELRAELAADTAAWKVPKRWAVRTEFPLTGRGKTDTRRLREEVFGGGDRGEMERRRE